MRRPRQLASRESGQGTVEYLLVLVITIIIILSLVYQFNHAFKTYAEAFFDGYIGCLLEMGELPGNNQCEFPDFNLAQGRMLLKDNLPSGSGGGGGGSSEGGSSKGDGQNSSETEGKSSDQASDESGGSDSDGPGEVSRNSSGGGGGGSNNFGNFGRGGRGRSTPIGSLKDSKEAGAFSGDALLNAPSSVAVGTVEGRGRRDMVRTFSYEGDGEEEDESGKPKSANTGRKVQNSNALKPKKAIENTNRKPATSSDGKGNGFSVGEFIRFLLLAALIIAIVIFFGGQLMQISKSREKGGD